MKAMNFVSPIETGVKHLVLVLVAGMGLGFSDTLLAQQATPKVSPDATQRDPLALQDKIPPQGESTGGQKRVWLDELDLSKIDQAAGEAVARKSMWNTPLIIGGDTFQRGV